MKGRGHHGLRELCIFLAGYFLYFGVRVATQGNVGEAMAHATAIMHFERNAGLAVEGGVQEAIVGHRMLVDIANAVYMYGHWPVLITGGVLLFHYRPDQYYRLRNAILVTGLIGLVIFALYPVAPPRLTDMPVIDTVTRDANGYRQIVPKSLVNQYAALPSFHVGWNVLLGIVVFGASGRWWLRLMAVVGPLAMGLAVLATANHYLVDVIAGVVIVIIALAALDIAERWRARPRLNWRGVRYRTPRGQRRFPAALR